MIRKFVWVGVLAAVTVATGSAQRGGGNRNGGGNMENMPMAPSRPNRLEILTQYLKLDKDQRRDVKNVMDEGQKEAAPLRDRMAKSRAELAAAVEGSKTAEIDSAVKSYAELQTKMAAVEMKAFAQVYKLLDSDQQQKTGGVFPMMAGVFKGKNWTEIEP
jgi:hypothetical protein